MPRPFTSVLYLLRRNVAEAVDPPKPQRYQGRILDWEGVRAVLEAVRTTSYPFPWFRLPC